MTITQQVIEAQKGSRAAFGALYESMAGDLYRMALYTRAIRRTPRTRWRKPLPRRGRG